MNLLSLIIIFLAIAIVGSIAFIAWELTSEEIMPRNNALSNKNESCDSKEPNEPHDSRSRP